MLVRGRGPAGPLFLCFAVGEFDGFRLELFEDALMDLVDLHDMWCLSGLLRSLGASDLVC